MPPVTIAVLLGMMAASGAAPASQEARQAFVEAERAYDLGHWDEAIRGFETSYRLTGDPILLFDLAQAHRQAGHVRAALTTYRAYLRQRPDAPNRAKVEERIADLEAQAPASRPPAPAASRAGDISDPFPVAPKAAGELTTTPAPAREPMLPGWAPWVGAGVTAGLATAAIVSTLSAQARYDHLRTTCAPSCSGGDIDGLRRRVVVRNLLWVATGVSAALTGVGFYVSQREATVSMACRF
jgi:hypothetical protein